MVRREGVRRGFGLHRPRCRALEANRAWACCAHPTHLLLRASQFEVLPESAHGCDIQLSIPPGIVVRVYHNGSP